MRILWLSRHTPQPEQVAELERIFGAVEIVQEPRTVSAAAEVVELLRENSCDEMVVVLPVPILADLVRISPVKPIRAVMERISTGKTNEKGEPEFEFRFSHFERVERIEVVTSRL